MKIIFTLILSGFLLTANALPFNFYGEIYYVPDPEIAGGLMSSELPLSTFDYNTAPLDHPLYTSGVYYPVMDCSNKNLWVRVRHIAADPNGTENGFNVPNTINSPFAAGPDALGGMYGFLYEFEIYADAVLTGERANVLDGLFPTAITVASLETLYNDGGILFEWLSFEILNEETSGWNLNSINFTGINVNSMPGFSAALNYSTTGTSTSAPTGFSTSFPTGSNTVYAVDMNLSNAQHSEFKMSAAGVSRFHYGYEFTSGGYQGMSMEFGGPPIVDVNITPSCGPEAGMISMVATGAEPIFYNWTPGNQASADNLAAGIYGIIVTDANGCTTELAAEVIELPEMSVVITGSSTEGVTTLEPVITGGTPSYQYQWNTGETTPTIHANEPGIFDVEIIDANGCTTNASYTIVSVKEVKAATILVSPNPTNGLVRFQYDQPATQLIITNAVGQVVSIQKLAAGGNSFILDLMGHPHGLYHYAVMDGTQVLGRGNIVRQ